VRCCDCPTIVPLHCDLIRFRTSACPACIDVLFLERVRRAPPFLSCLGRPILIFSLALATGLRRGELQTLHRSDLDLARRRVHVTAKPEYGFLPKDWEERTVPLTREVVAILKSTTAKKTVPSSSRHQKRAATIPRSPPRQNQLAPSSAAPVFCTIFARKWRSARSESGRKTASPRQRGGLPRLRHVLHGDRIGGAGCLATADIAIALLLTIATATPGSPFEDAGHFIRCDTSIVSTALSEQTVQTWLQPLSQYFVHITTPCRVRLHRGRFLVERRHPLSRLLHPERTRIYFLWILLAAANRILRRCISDDD